LDFSCAGSQGGQTRLKRVGRTLGPTEMSKRPRNDPSKEEDAAEGEPETRRRVCLVPWSHSPAARRRCLYLVLDDWKRGYSVHRLGEADFVESDARLILDARSSASRRCTSTRRPSRPTGPRSWRCIPSGSAPVSPCSTLSFRCGYCAHSGPCPPQLRARRPGPTQSRSRSMHSKIRVRA